jgi:O-antigen ligase
MDRKMASAPLSWLLLVLPFEATAPSFRTGPLRFTLLELVAAAGLIACAAALARSGRLRALRSSPFLFLAVAFLLVNFLSAAAAAHPRAEPLKFSLRVMAGVAAFSAASVALRGDAVKRWLQFLVASATVVSLLGLAELAEVPGVSLLTPWFREHDFRVGGSLRLAATFAYPNIAAAFLVTAVPGAAGYALHRASAMALPLLLFVAIVLTYSRAAVMAAFFTLVPLALWCWRARDRAAGVRLAALGSVMGAIWLVVTFGAPSFRLRTISENDLSWYRARFEHHAGGELSLQPGELARTPVTVENTGRLAWQPTGERPFHVSYHWYDPRARQVLPIEGERTALPTTMGPGEAVRLEALVRAPAEPGHYLLLWDMVQEHYTWFVDKSGIEAFVPVVVGSPGEPPAEPVSPVVAGLHRDPWQPGRWEIWKLAYRLFTERPLLGVGPDNFRLLYGRAAGRVEWDTRHRSDSLFVEILATTGLAGAIPFFGLVAGLGFNLIRGLGRAERDPTGAVLAGSLVGFLVQGVFDYFLAFTPTYLLTWMLLGGSSAALAREYPG